MKKVVKKLSKNKVVSWNTHLDKKYGRHGTLTQAEMPEKTGTKKSYISRIENGRADIQLSTLYRLIEQGLNRKLEFSIH